MSRPPSKKARTRGEEDGVLSSTSRATGVLEMVWRHIYPFLAVGDVCRAGKTCQTLRGCSREHDQVVAYSIGTTDDMEMECQPMQQMMDSICLERIEVLRFDIDTNLWTWQEKLALFQHLLTMLPHMKKISHLSLYLSHFFGGPYLDRSKRGDIERLLPRLRDVLTACKSLTSLRIYANLNAELLAAEPLIKHGNLTHLSIEEDDDIGTIQREDWRGLATALVNAKRLEVLSMSIDSNLFAEEIVSVIGEKGQGSPLHLREFCFGTLSGTPFDLRSILSYFTFNSECLQSVATHCEHDDCGVDGETLKELLDRSPSIRKLDIAMPSQDHDGSVARVLAKFAMTDGRWARPGLIKYWGDSDVDYAPGLGLYFEINQTPHKLQTLLKDKAWSIETFCG